MLDTFVDIAPNPKPREASSRMVADESEFTGFIFKIHANIDPKHRDRIAFLRVCREPEPTPSTSTRGWRRS